MTTTAARLQELASKYVPAIETGAANVPTREIWDVEVVYDPALNKNSVSRELGSLSRWHFFIPLDICPTREEAMTFPTRLGYILDPKYFQISAVQATEIVNTSDAPADTSAEFGSSNTESV